MPAGLTERSDVELSATAAIELTQDRHQLIHSVGAGVPFQNRSASLFGHSTRGVGIIEQRPHMLPHLKPIARNQVVFSRGEQMLGVLPR